MISLFYGGDVREYYRRRGIVMWIFDCRYYFFIFLRYN